MYDTFSPAEYGIDDSVNEILLVTHREGSLADLEFLVRGEYGEFASLLSGEAFIGKNGIGKEREGDGKSPVGVFGIRTAFGILPNPGTALEYIEVKDSTYACDDDCEYYNQIIDIVSTGHDCHGEHMIEYTAAYAYGMATDYNPGNVYPLGSAIFIHCKGRNPWTAGCVSMDENLMKQILQRASTTMKVIIR